MFSYISNDNPADQYLMSSPIPTRLDRGRANARIKRKQLEEKRERLEELEIAMFAKQKSRTPSPSIVQTPTSREIRRLGILITLIQTTPLYPPLALIVSQLYG